MARAGLTSRVWLPCKRPVTPRCAMVIMLFLHLLPLSTAATGSLALSPDLLICACPLPGGCGVRTMCRSCCWRIVMLLADLLFHRPPGLLAMPWWCLAQRIPASPPLRRPTRGHELCRRVAGRRPWLIAAITVFLMNRDRSCRSDGGCTRPRCGPSPDPDLLMTIAFYPIVVLVSQSPAGRPPQAGAVMTTKPSGRHSDEAT